MLSQYAYAWDGQIGESPKSSLCRHSFALLSLHPKSVQARTAFLLFIPSCIGNICLMVISGRETCTTIQRGVFMWPCAGRDPALLGTLFWEVSAHFVMQLKEDYWGGGVTPDQIGLPTTDSFYLQEQRHFPPCLELFLQDPVGMLKLLRLTHFKGGNIAVCSHKKTRIVELFFKRNTERAPSREGYRRPRRPGFP